MYSSPFIGACSSASMLEQCGNLPYKEAIHLPLSSPKTPRLSKSVCSWVPYCTTIGIEFTYHWKQLCDHTLIGQLLDALLLSQDSIFFPGDVKLDKEIPTVCLVNPAYTGKRPLSLKPMLEGKSSYSNRDWKSKPNSPGQIITDSPLNPTEKCCPYRF